MTELEKAVEDVLRSAIFDAIHNEENTNLQDNIDDKLKLYTPKLLTLIESEVRKARIDELRKMEGKGHTDNGIVWWIDLEDVNARIDQLEKGKE